MKLNILPENPQDEKKSGHFPSWLHRKLPKGGNLFKTEELIKKYQLSTVCEEAKCPNRFECYDNKIATFLALGKTCTRNCGFCDIDFSKTPQAPEPDEPRRIALSVKELGLRHAVITMVARDDLPDKGASHIAAIIDAIWDETPKCTIEVLTSDFSGDFEALDKVLTKKPKIFNHNIETVEELTPRVRHKATYSRSLSVLKYAKDSGKTLFIKSGLMIGLGESKSQVFETIKALQEVGVDIITIGQYLQPNHRKLLVKEFISPQLFKEYEEYGHQIGVRHMSCGPFVRSSYHAHEICQ